MAPSPRSLILDLLSTLRRGSMPVAALVAAGELFDLAEGSLRVALARLCARGEVERDERGRYRLGPAARAHQARVAGWRRLAARTRPWRGRWLGIHDGALRGRRRERESHRRALGLLGFAALDPGLWLRADNLRVGPEDLRRELAELGLAEEAHLFRLQDLDAAREARARELWDVSDLARGYRSARDALARSDARLGALDPERAMVETFRVGGGVLRQLVRDPLLPDEILPTAERDALVEAMRAYDRRGRACWAEFLERFGVPHRQAPTHTSWGPAEPTRSAAGGNP